MAFTCTVARFTLVGLPFPKGTSVVCLFYIFGSTKSTLIDIFFPSGISRNQLQEHNASEHAFLSSWPCTSTCGLEFSTSESLSEHITMAHFEGIFHCTVEGCPYQAITRSMVVQHTQKEHLVVTGQGSEQVKYSTITLSCPEDDCSEFFLTEDILNKHMINAHGKFPFVCLLSPCMQTFNSR